MVRVSSGTASVLGLKKVRLDAVPSTAYLMVGQRCLRSCGFCPQAANSQSPTEYLSRVTWPSFSLEDLLTQLKAPETGGPLSRICIQVVETPGADDELREVLAQLKDYTAIPVAVSLFPSSVDRAIRVVDWGADRVGLPLDAANADVFARVRGGSFEHAWQVITEAAARLPGKVSTHLIVGLGETDEDLVRTIALTVEKGIRVGLFAFTPVRGTEMGGLRPPDLKRYRRIQAGHYLLTRGLVSYNDFHFKEGQVVDFGLGLEELKTILGNGKAFQTSGCPGCNRPYYNERPGQTPYNFPGPLESSEVLEALSVITEDS